MLKEYTKEIRINQLVVINYKYKINSIFCVCISTLRGEEYGYQYTNVCNYRSPVHVNEFTARFETRTKNIGCMSVRTSVNPVYLGRQKEKIRNEEM